MGRKDAQGRPIKTTFGPWMMKALGALAGFKGLRGTPFDIVGYNEERRLERRLITDYEALVDELLARLKPEKSFAGCGYCFDSGENSWLWAREANTSKESEGRRAGVADPVPRGTGAGRHCGGVEA